MTSQALGYRGYRFPPEIISHAVWLYHRFSRASAMQGISSPSEASSSPTRPSDGGVDTSVRRMRARCDADGAGWAIRGMWTSCSSRCRGSGTTLEVDCEHHLPAYRGHSVTLVGAGGRCPDLKLTDLRSSLSDLSVIGASTAASCGDRHLRDAPGRPLVRRRCWWLSRRYSRGPETYGQIEAFGIEGTGGYGVGLARAVCQAGHRVLEVNEGTGAYAESPASPTPSTRGGRPVGAGRPSDGDAQTRTVPSR